MEHCAWHWLVWSGDVAISAGRHTSAHRPQGDTGVSRWSRRTPRRALGLQVGSRQSGGLPGSGVPVIRRISRCRVQGTWRKCPALSFQCHHGCVLQGHLPCSLSPGTGEREEVEDFKGRVQQGPWAAVTRHTRLLLKMAHLLSPSRRSESQDSRFAVNVTASAPVGHTLRKGSPAAAGTPAVPG